MVIQVKLESVHPTQTEPLVVAQSLNASSSNCVSNGHDVVDKVSVGNPLVFFKVDGTLHDYVMILEELVCLQFQKVVWLVH
jgi:hypothetical protein